MKICPLEFICLSLKMPVVGCARKDLGRHFAVINSIKNCAAMPLLSAPVAPILAITHVSVLEDTMGKDWLEIALVSFCLLQGDQKWPF